MRSNLPVTNVEYSIADETLIVSKTDLKGKLTYFNDQFVQASGFTEQELIGQPHNIIRHPDMPPEAFENLWDTLKAGKPWAGAVKNRRKNGDFYWVLASATPIYEGGQVTGYMSIRTRLPADQRKEAEQVYALLRARKASAYRIDAGMIRKRSAADLFAFSTRSLKARLGTMVGTLAAATLVVSAVGFLAMNQINSHAKSIYEDRAVPLAQLFEINDRMKDNSLALYGAVANGRAGQPVGDVSGRIAANIEAIGKSWSDYMATYLTPEEKGVADAFGPKRGEYVQKGLKVGLSLLADGKYDDLSAHMAGKSADLFAEAKRDLDKLVAIQLKEAKAEYNAAERAYLISNVVALAVALPRPSGWCLAGTRVHAGDRSSARAPQRRDGEHRPGAIQQPCHRRAGRRDRRCAAQPSGAASQAWLRPGGKEGRRGPHGAAAQDRYAPARQ